MLGSGLHSALVMKHANAHLGTYLNDHLAGAAAALEILDSLEKHQDPGLRRFAQGFRPPILEDRDELIRLMRESNISISSTRRAIGWIAEQAAELKLKVDDPADSGLRTFELLEMLALGIDGKRALWAVLRSIAEAVPSLRSADYRRLASRVDDQRATVEVRRIEWAFVAFTASAP